VRLAASARINSPRLTIARKVSYPRQRPVGRRWLRNQSRSRLNKERERIMAHRSFTQSSAFEPEAIAVMSEALEAACKELRDTDQPEVMREVIAGRIIAAARLGERDPLRLREAALP
jgi:hypothetical protein